MGRPWPSFGRSATEKKKAVLRCVKEPLHAHVLASRSCSIIIYSINCLECSDELIELWWIGGKSLDGEDQKVML